MIGSELSEDLNQASEEASDRVVAQLQITRVCPPAMHDWQETQQQPACIPTLWLHALTLVGPESSCCALQEACSVGGFMHSGHDIHTHIYMYVCVYRSTPRMVDKQGILLGTNIGNLQNRADRKERGAHQFVEETHGSPHMPSSAASSDGSIVGAQVGLGCAGGVPGSPEQVHHPCKVQHGAVGLYEYPKLPQ